MEFHEKLQQLRKQNTLTQEQLAERLFVSRTAVSKWESGRGYPNLESLKCLSKLFGVSIDELLSNNELIELAETENRSNIKKVSGLVFGLLDVITLSLLFLPLFGKKEGDYIRAVALLEDPGVGGGMRMAYVCCLIAVAVFGGWEIAMELTDREEGLRFCKTGSILLCGGVILFSALTRQPYLTTFLFLLFLVKVFLLLRENRLQ